MSSCTQFSSLLEQLGKAHEEELSSLREQVQALQERLQQFQAEGEPPAPELRKGAEQSLGSSEGNDAVQVACEENSASDTAGHGGELQEHDTAGKQVPRGSVHSGSKHRPLESPFAVTPAKVKAEPRGLLDYIQLLVDRPAFEIFFALLIVLNAFVLASEAQYSGLDVGYELGHPGSPRRAEDAWPHAELVFEVLEWFFGIVFTIEIVLKVLCARSGFLRDPWNIMDFLICVVWFVMRFGSELFPFPPGQLRLLRLVRLLRLLRLVRTIQGFDSLYIMTTALKGSAPVLLWACALLAVVQMFLALIMQFTLREYYFYDTSRPEDERRQVYVYFGTFSRAMMSMFEVTLANWPPICRVLAESVHEVFMLLAIIHKLTIGFAVVGVINGVFMQETFKVASNDDTIMLRQKEAVTRRHKITMEKLFSRLHHAHDGEIELSEFEQLITDEALHAWLSAYDLSVGTDAAELFSLIDADQNGKVSLPELVAGVGKLRGQARSIDLARLSRDHKELRDLVRRSAVRV